MTKITGFTVYQQGGLIGVDSADEAVSFLRASAVEAYTYDPNNKELTVRTASGGIIVWRSEDSTTAELDDALFAAMGGEETDDA